MSAFVERMQQLVVYHRHARFLQVVENARPLRRCPYCGEHCLVDDGACAGHLDLLYLENAEPTARLREESAIGSNTKGA